jgi:HEAT repeat protein
MDGPASLERLIEMIRSSDPLTYEDGYHLLIPHVANYVPELISLVRGEPDPKIRGRYVELLGEARNPEALDTLAAELSNSDQNVRQWALTGLRLLGVSEADELVQQYEVNHPEEFR